MQWLNSIPTSMLIVASIFLGLAPFVPEPHVLEKLRMLVQGNLTQPVDIFDLFFHLLPLLLLALQVAGKKISRKKNSG